MFSTILSTTLLGLKRVWDWAKPHLFQMLITAVVTYCLLTLFRGGKADLTTQISKMQEINDAQIKRIVEAQETQRRAHEENLKRLETELNEIQQRHDAAIKALEQQKQKDTAKLIQVYGGDPKGMAQQVSTATGIPVYNGK